MKGIAALVFLGFVFASPPTSALHERGEGRRTTPKDFAVEVHRYQLPNGLVVLLSPDPTVTSTLVWLSFRAGTLYEPRGRSGMAHLVEHIMASGPTAETDYAALLERRRARDFNASTDVETMRFEVTVPAAELPVALWVAADRLASIPPLIDAAMVERNRRVVLQERAIRNVDAPYGLVREHLFKRLYPDPHPLHGSVAGAPVELARVTAEDVRAFVETLLVPANAVLTVAGRFDPAVARQLIEESLGRLPPGRRAQVPPLPPLVQSLVDAKEELISREPRVTVAWRFRNLSHDDAIVLRLGAQLLSLRTDGAWGMRLRAGFEEYAFESLLRVELTVPYDEPAAAVQNDVEGFLRQLTGREVPFDFLQTANLALDRAALFDIGTLEGRAARLTDLELVSSSRMTVSQDAGAHWMLDPPAVREMAREYLKTPRVMVHARPIRPRPARLERE